MWWHHKLYGAAPAAVAHTTGAAWGARRAPLGNLYIAALGCTCRGVTNGEGQHKRAAKRGFDHVSSRAGSVKHTQWVPPVPLRPTSLAVAAEDLSAT